MQLRIDRFSDDGKQTLGKGLVYDVIDGVEVPKFSFVTLELPWKDNTQSVSCIPDGTYHIKKRVSEKHGQHFHILDVPGREFILIHSANFSRQLKGCIAPGASHFDINKDGLKDVTSSKTTLTHLLELLPEESELEITSAKTVKNIFT